MQTRLSIDEMQRAKTFRFVGDKSRYIVCRAILRTLLGRYLSFSAAQIELRYGPTGKPFVDSNSADPALSFNLSHSQRTVLVAVTRGRQVGVDLESIRFDLNIDELSRYVLTDSERSDLEGLSPEQKVRRFLKFWTRKEAYLKARGEGLGGDLRGIDVRTTLSGTGHQHTVPVDQRPTVNALNWCIRDLAIGGDHIAALAASDHRWSLRYFRSELTELGRGAAGEMQRRFTTVYEMIQNDRVVNRRRRSRPVGSSDF